MLSININKCEANDTNCLACDLLTHNVLSGTVATKR